MSLDPISEKIAHFIGAFELLLEQSRLRLEYDEFRAAQKLEQEAKILELHGTGVKHAHALKDYDGELGYKGAADTAAKPDTIVKGSSDIPKGDAKTTQQAAPTEAGPLPTDQQLQTLSQAPQPGPQPQSNTDTPVITPAEINYNISPPGSVETVTFQINELFDNDIFGDIGAVHMQSVVAMGEALEAVFNLVPLLSPISADLNPFTADWGVEIVAMQEIAQTLSELVAETLTVTVISGVEATDGIFVNGIKTEEMPDFNDFLPRLVAEEIATQEAEAEAAITAHNFNADFGDTPDHSNTDGGREVVTGENSSVNTASITSFWLDAPVIVVAGDVIRFDGISQTNVLIEHDRVSPDLLSKTTVDNASVAMNVAAIGLSSSQMTVPQTGANTKTVDVLTNPPENWSVVRYEGPITQINWVHQISFTTDFDQSVVSQSGSGLYLGMGDNSASNAFEIFELGFQYDLIIVNGNMIDIDLIKQTNILLDSDFVSTNTPLAYPNLNQQPLTTEGQSANPATLTNTGDGAHAAAPNAAAPVAAALPVGNTSSMLNTGEATEGAANASDGVVGINATPAATQDVVPVAQAENEDPAPTQNAASISTSDNLLFNEAIIETIGADVDTVITETFQNAINDLVGGAKTVSQDVANDANFDGIELLRVLYIDGDFTTVNFVDQTNILGDNDQVHILRDDFAAALQDEIQISTGSNILANVATIRDSGIDSVVMAQGETYSDALIHQANLVDNDITAPGAAISDLATEAVAFLASDMLGDDMGADIAAAAYIQLGDMPGSSDIMQSMLA